jgi:hypothetical protein
MKIYEKRAGFRLKVNAQDAGEELQRISEKHGGATPQNIVDESREEGAVLHPEFEWCDEIAAEAHRRTQASTIVRAVVVIEPDMPKTRAFESVSVNVLDDDAKPEQKYYSREHVMSHAEARAELIGQAIKEAVSLRQRYRDLSELAEVFAAIDKAAEALAS